MSRNIILRMLVLTLMSAVHVMSLQARGGKGVMQYCQRDVMLCDSTLIVKLDVGATEIDIEACCAMVANKEGRKVSDRGWKIDLVTESGDTHGVMLSWGNERYGEFDDNRYLKVACDDAEPLMLTKGVNTASGDNTLVIEYRRDNSSEARVYVGSDKLTYAGCVNVDCGSLVEVRLTSVAGCLDVGVLSVEACYEPSLESGLTIDEIEMLARQCNRDDVVGIWQYLDRENDPDYARPGGKYRLAIVPVDDRHQTFQILYLDGADVSAGRWHAGMIKGTMEASPLDGAYNLTWYGSDGRPVDDESTVTVTDGFMVVSFPLHLATMRFARVTGTSR